MFCPGGSGEGGAFVRGAFVLGGFCPGGFCQGGFCPGAYVRSPGLVAHKMHHVPLHEFHESVFVFDGLVTERHNPIFE